MRFREIALLLLTFLILGLVLVLARVDFNLLLHYFAMARYQVFIPVFFLLLLQWALNAIRIQWIAKKQCPLDFLETLRLNFAGGLLSMLTPMRVGDMGRAFFLKQLGKSTLWQGVNFFLFDKVLSFFTLILIGGLSFLWLGVKIPGTNLLFLSSLGLVSLAIGLFFFFSKLGLGVYSFSLIFLLSCASWFLHLLQVYCFFFALHAQVSPLKVIALVPIAILVGLLPITLGGMGTRDAAMLFLFRGLDPSLVIGVSFLFTARYWLEGLIGIPFVGGYFKTRGVSVAPIGN